MESTQLPVVHQLLRVPAQVTYESLLESPRTCHSEMGSHCFHEINHPKRSRLLRSTRWGKGTTAARNGHVWPTGPMNGLIDDR